MTLLGHLIVAEVVSGVSRPTVIYTPWSGRQGNAFTSTFEVSAISGTDVKVTVEVLEKDADDTGAGTLNSGTGTNYRIGTGVSSFRNSDCKQLVRYRVTLGTSTAEPSGTYTMYVILRLLNPSWEWSGG